MNKQAVLIVNTRSRRGRDHFQTATKALQAAGIELTESHAIVNPANLVETTRRVVQRKAPLVIIGGGDGTLSSVLSCFVAGESVYGVLPLGTGNQFARDLGISTDLSAAIDVLVNGKVCAVDLGVVNAKYFLNVATIGLTTMIAASLTTEAKRRFGRAVYVVALVKALATMRPFQLTLTVDPPPEQPGGRPPVSAGANAAAGSTDLTTEGQDAAVDVMVRHVEVLRALQVVIGNGRFHAGPFPLAPNATITDGRLVVYAVAGVSRWTLLKFALKLPGGQHVNLAQVPAYNVARGSLVTTPRQRVTVDGEIALRTPLDFSVAAKALRVMVPQTFPEDEQF